MNLQEQISRIQSMMGIISESDDKYINYLLDKINKKGIDSLSDSEKNRLD